MKRPLPPFVSAAAEQACSRATHWIDALTGTPQAITAPGVLPSLSVPLTAAAGTSSPAGRPANTADPATAQTSSGVSPLQSVVASSSTTLNTTTAATTTNTSPQKLLRTVEPWSQARVNALIANGTIQASWLPDMRAVAPEKLNLQREHQRDMLRFSNSIANTGANNLQVRRGIPIADIQDATLQQQILDYAKTLGLDTTQLALTAQELLNPDGSVAAVVPDAALSEFHPAHKHFHIGETAEFSLERRNSQGGWDPLTGLEVVKTTFCLIDVNRIQPAGTNDPNQYEVVKSPANANVYNDCFADVQGIQAGWIDRYSHSLPGQEVDITSLAAGTYRLVVNVNPSSWFLESNYSNNTSSVGFNLERNQQGQAFLTQLPELTTGLWFSQSPNGMG